MNPKNSLALCHFTPTAAPFVLCAPFLLGQPQKSTSKTKNQNHRNPGKHFSSNRIQKLFACHLCALCPMIVVKHRDARQFLPFKKFQARTAARTNKINFIGKTTFINGSYGISAANN